MARIYTSYFANWRNFPEGSLMIGVTRFPPTFWENGINIAALAPSEDLLRRYKNKQIDEYVFKTIYLTELADRGFNSKAVRNLLNAVSKNRDIVLCCYEKPEDFCHRHILAEWLGEDVKEL